MDAYRIQVKLYLEPESAPRPASLIPIFHRWIQRGILDETLIDVADYSSVPHGPGVLLIAHHAHYSLDATDGRLGLVYTRKRPEDGPFQDRLRASWHRTLAAARALAAEPPFHTQLTFQPGRAALRLMDRLHAPNTEETLQAVEPEARALLTEIYGGASFTLRHEDDPRSCFGLQIEAESGVLPDWPAIGN